MYNTASNTIMKLNGMVFDILHEKSIQNKTCMINLMDNYVQNNTAILTGKELQIRILINQLVSIGSISGLSTETKTLVNHMIDHLFNCIKSISD